MADAILMSLHSNLVLFKYHCPLRNLFLLLLYIPIWFYSNSVPVRTIQDWESFTFQSGSIQMKMAWQGIKDFFAFTFQSGSIQIEVGKTYIECDCSFTFQSGSIQIHLQDP